MEKKNKTLGSIFLSNFTNKDNKVEKETQYNNNSKPQLIEQAEPVNPAITQFKQSLLSGISNKKLGGEQNGQV